MATQSALGQNIGTLTGIAQLISSLTGDDKTVTRSGGTTTSTKQTQISQEGLKALIQSMLEDPSTGLAKVASGGRTSGIYNSSTQQLLVNDLISRASNAAALASSPTTTTETTPKITETTASKGLLGSSANSLMLPALGIGLLMKKDSDGKSMFDTLASAIGGVFGGDGDSGSTASNFIFGDASPLSGTITSLSGMDTASDSAFNLGAVSDIITGVISGDSGSGIGDLISDAGSFIKDAADELIDTISGWF